METSKFWNILLLVIVSYFGLFPSRSCQAEEDFRTAGCYDDGLKQFPFWYRYLLESAEDPKDALQPQYDPRVDCSSMDVVTAAVEKTQGNCQNSEHEAYFALWTLKDRFIEICEEYGCYYAGKNCIETQVHVICEGLTPECLKFPYKVCDMTANFYKEELEEYVVDVKAKCAHLGGEANTRSSSSEAPNRVNSVGKLATSESSVQQPLGPQQPQPEEPQPEERQPEKSVLSTITGESTDSLLIRLQLALPWDPAYNDLSNPHSTVLVGAVQSYFQHVYQEHTRLVDDIDVLGFEQGSVNMDVVLHSVVEFNLERSISMGAILNESLIRTDYNIRTGQENITVTDVAIVVNQHNTTRYVTILQSRECFGFTLNSSCYHGQCETTFFGQPRCRCDRGYKGSHCTDVTSTRSDSVAAIVGVAVFGGIVLIMFIVLGIIFICKDSNFLASKKRGFNQTLTKSSVHSPSAIPIVQTTPKKKHPTTPEDVALTHDDTVAV